MPLMDLIGIGIGYVYQIVKDRSALIQYPTDWLMRNVFSQPWVKDLYSRFSA